MRQRVRSRKVAPVQQVTKRKKSKDEKKERKKKAMKVIKRVKKTQKNVTHSYMMSLYHSTEEKYQRLVILTAINMLQLVPEERQMQAQASTHNPPRVIPPSNAKAALTLYMLWRFRREWIPELYPHDKYIIMMIADKIMQ